MKQEERARLDAYPRKRISVGITADGSRVNSGFVPWESTAHAFNMRTPDVYFEEADFSDPVILARLDELEVIGCYIFTPLESYDFLARFSRMKDLHIQKGHNLRSLSFARGMTEWFMFYLEDAELEDLDDLFLQPEHARGIFAYCFGLTNCKVKEIGAIAQSSLRLSELIIRGPANVQEQARWRAVPALKHRYYVLKGLPSGFTCDKGD